jgi:FkbM family methyltransferase
MVRYRKSTCIQMNLTPLLLPYTRAELYRYDALMHWVGVGWRAGQKEEWKSLPAVVIRGKRHGFLMKLDRYDWCQRLTYFTGRYYEFGVLSTLDLLLRPGDGFVDIGANIGMVTLHARHLVGASGRIDCFEPNPHCVTAIHEHLSMNGIKNVNVHPCALADKPGSLRLKLTSEHTGTATLSEVGGDAIKTLDVDVRIGDDEIDEAPRVIKIDVEGFELHVLKGLSRTLTKHRPFLITELLDAHLSRAGTSVSEVATFLRDHGYRAYGVRSGRKRRFLPERLLLREIRPDDVFDATDVLWAHVDEPLPSALCSCLVTSANPLWQAQLPSKALIAEMQSKARS